MFRRNDPFCFDGWLILPTERPYRGVFPTALTQDAAKAWKVWMFLRTGAPSI